jgi:pyruvate/oxaloacetate carboxyltransferase
VHTVEHYVGKAKELESMGVQSICIKDMAGIIAPYITYDIVKGMRDAGIKVPIQIHCHYTAAWAPWLT